MLLFKISWGGVAGLMVGRVVIVWEMDIKRLVAKDLCEVKSPYHWRSYVLRPPCKEEAWSMIS